MKFVACRNILNVVNLKKIEQFEIQKSFANELKVLMINLMNKMKRLKLFIKKIK